MTQARPLSTWSRLENQASNYAKLGYSFTKAEQLRRRSGEEMWPGDTYLCHGIRKSCLSLIGVISTHSNNRMTLTQSAIIQASRDNLETATEFLLAFQRLSSHCSLQREALDSGKIWWHVYFAKWSWNASVCEPHSLIGAWSFAPDLLQFLNQLIPYHQGLKN